MAPSSVRARIGAPPTGPEGIHALVSQGMPRSLLSACGYARAMASSPVPSRALRAVAGGQIDAEVVAAKARELGVMGWVRPTGEIHAEGAPDAVRSLMALLGDAVA